MFMFYWVIRNVKKKKRITVPISKQDDTVKCKWKQKVMNNKWFNLCIQRKHQILDLVNVPLFWQAYVHHCIVSPHLSSSGILALKWPGFLQDSAAQHFRASCVIFFRLTVLRMLQRQAWTAGRDWALTLSSWNKRALLRRRPLNGSTCEPETCSALIVSSEMSTSHAPCTQLHRHHRCWLKGPCLPGRTVMFD